MATKRMENWDAGDFSRSFRSAASDSLDSLFKEKFAALANALEPMGREFCKETVSCGRSLASTMEDVQSIAARGGYCSSPRGFEKDCESLYHDVDQTISKIESLRDKCFL